MVVEPVAPPLPRDVVEHVDRDGVGVHVRRHAVPVVQGMEPLVAGPPIVVAYGERQRERRVAEPPDVGPHRLAEAGQRTGERRSGQRADHFRTERAREHLLEGVADTSEHTGPGPSTPPSSIIGPR